MILNYEGEIWIGDLMRAIARLKPRDERSKATVAGLLGFKWRGRKTLAQAPSGQEVKVGARAQELKPLEGQPRPQPPPTEPRAMPSTAKSEALSVLLEPRQERGDRSATLSRPWEAQKSLEKVTERHFESDPPYQPLFKRRGTREILAALAARRSGGGAVDTRRLVATVAKGRPIESIPLLSRHTLAGGVQLLVDLGAAMEPFRRDQEELGKALKGVVGDSHVEELSFCDCPSRGCFDAESWEEIIYQPPAPGTLVLVLSDMGIGGPRLHRERASVEEWTELAGRLYRRHCTLLVLVPYPEDRWRKPLTRIIVHVPWDRSTSIGKVKELLG